MLTGVFTGFAAIQTTVFPENNEVLMTNSKQRFIDDFYKSHGDCCAGCDHWQWHNTAVGDCTKSAPVSSRERHSMLGVTGCSSEPSAGHILTKRDHVCGDFIDTHEWSN